MFNQPVYSTAPPQYMGNQQPNNFQPQPNQQQIQIQSNCDFITVPGPEHVKEYIVRPNQKLFFLDSNRPILYVKEADSVGITKTEAMRLDKIDFESLFSNKTESSGVVSLDDFNALAGDIRSLINQVNNQSETIKNLEEEISSIKATKSESKPNQNNKRYDKK